MKTLEEEFGCLGLHGLGSGIAWGKANIKPNEKLNGADSYCATKCALKTRCWQMHMSKCRLMYPNSTKHFDKMVEHLGQFPAMELWKSQHPQTPMDPYLLQMVANVEDGLEIGKGNPVKHRGRWTLKWQKP